MIERESILATSAQVEPAADHSRWPIVVMAALAGAAVLGPALIDAPPGRTDLGRVLLAPRADHLLGTDHLGRDVLARLTAALRVSLVLAVLSTGLAAVVGVLLGLLAARATSAVDRGLSAIADGLVALPALLLLLLVSAFAPGELWPFSVGISATLWVEFFRVTRTVARTQYASPQVEASRLLGFDELYVTKRHVWPEVVPVLTTLVVFGIGTAVLSLATVSFLGVGLRPPRTELGLMMSEYFPYVFEAPWLVAIPTSALMVVMTCLAWASQRLK